MSTEAQKRASEKYRLSHKDYYNKKSREYAKKLRVSQKDYKSRIDKAIEYMKSIELEPDADMYMQIGEYNEYKYLLNILQGSEDNE